MLKKFDFRKYNYLLVLVILAISVFGVLMINSASTDESMWKKQLFGILIGFFIMIAVSLIDYNFILKFYWLIYALMIAILVVVFVKGATWGGAQRWIVIGNQQFQPSEFSKIMIILFIAKLLTVNRERISNFTFLAILAVILGIPLFLIFKEPDLSTTLLIFLVLVTMIYASGLRYKNIFLILLCVVPVLITGIIYIQSPDQKLLEPYQVNRIMSFIEPEKYDSQRYQQDNAVKAIGSGQLYGKGYNNKESNSVKNANFIAEAESDFIFAVVGEEFGFIGGCFLIFLLAFLVFECILISVFAKDFQGRLICCGYGALIAYSCFINIGVVTEILPNTGLPLPFVSKGLSSLLSLYGGAGVVLNVSLNRREKL